MLALVVGSLVLAGCSPQAEEPTATAVADRSDATTESPPVQSAPDDGAMTDPSAPHGTPLPPLTVEDSVGEATPLALALYTGGEVAMTDAVERRLAPAIPAPGDSTTRTVAGSTGTWDGHRIAVLTSQDDVTFAVRTGGVWRVVGGWWPSLGVEAAGFEGQRTVLLVGSDARPGQAVGRARADALQLVTTRGAGGAVLGVPRDSWVEVPGHGRSKVNSALTYGGPDLLVRTIVGATGVPIDGYLMVGFEDFKALVDDAGGLPILLEAAMSAMWASLPEGEQRLTGAKALAFARERQSLPTGDLARSGHQGELVLAGLDLARELGPERLPALMTGLDRTVDTDLSAADALTLLGRVYLLDPDKVGHAVAVGPTGTSADGQSIVRWDAGTRAVIEDFADGRLAGSP